MADPVPSYSLSGELVGSDTGFVLLNVPNSLVRGMFDALAEPGAELPPSPDGRLNAHVSVFRKEEVESLGGIDKIRERGKHFHYSIGRLKELEPAGWPDMERAWILQVHSPELISLRRGYGLPDMPKYPFHITIAVRRRGVLKRNQMAKAAAWLGTAVDSPEPWVAVGKSAAFMGLALAPLAEQAGKILAGPPAGYVGVWEYCPVEKGANLLVTEDAPTGVVERWAAGLQALCPVAVVRAQTPLPHNQGWLKLAASPFLRRMGELLNFVPGEYLPGVPNYATPLSATLTGGVAGAGLGYGLGWLGEKALPRRWTRGNLRHTMSLLGGLMGAAPGLALTADSLSEGESPLSPGLLGSIPRDETAGSLGQSPDWVHQRHADWNLQKGGREMETGANFSVNLDEFNRVLWGDPSVRSRVPVVDRGLLTSAMETAQHLPGGNGPGFVNPLQLGQLAAGMGAGWASGALVGMTLGKLVGMPEETQDLLKRTGIYAGVLNTVAPALFGH